jgi:beta-N-acetylglucosaminidase
MSKSSEKNFSPEVTPIIYRILQKVKQIQHFFIAKKHKLCYNEFKESHNRGKTMKQMKKKKKLLWASLAVLLTVAVILSLSILIFGSSQPFSGKIAEYYDHLIEIGFPESYAEELTKLHLIPPNWEFIPLSVTTIEPDYTWNYVIDKETEKEETNLIYADDTYQDYRHLLNHRLYDSGYYQASNATVKYFMDPRNFLNETDIFQFYDLSRPTNCTEQSINAVLSGTFMDGATLENGKTYGAYLIEIGQELGIDPIYLAVKLRQEQGVDGTSPVIGGKCGDLLLYYYQNKTPTTESGKPVNVPEGELDESALLSLNGLYNPFNLKASGNGVFSIYKNAMERAMQGTPSMSAAWDGSPAWNTIWKGIYGGAVYIRDSYILRYQSTLYLQKFNVDGRISENNFRFQYMQNVAGAFQESRTLYQFFAANGLLDESCKFLIPVYGGMPKTACKDPADGNCTPLTPAVNRYETSVSLTAPERIKEENGAIFADFSVKYNEELKISGTFTHSYGVSNLEYSWDGQEFIPFSDSEDGELSFLGNLPDYGEHILVIRGKANYDPNSSSKKQNCYFLCAALNITIKPPPKRNLTIVNGSTVEQQMHYDGSTLSLPSCDDVGFVGWVGSDGSFLPENASFTITQDLEFSALTVDFRVLEGASISLGDTPHKLRFYAVLSQSDAERLKHQSDSLSLTATVYRNNTSVETVNISSTDELVALDGSRWLELSADTPALTSESDLEARFSVEFFLVLTYSNGEIGYVPPCGLATPRTAVSVAISALADPYGNYSEEAILRLRALLPKFDS